MTITVRRIKKRQAHFWLVLVYGNCTSVLERTIGKNPLLGISWKRLGSFCSLGAPTLEVSGSP